MKPKPVYLEYISIKKSKVHGSGVVAKKFISKGTRIIEYTGEKVTNKEGDRRAEEQVEKAKHNSGLGSVYVFELNDEYCIDGNFEYNVAGLINHSCDPNCEYKIMADRIWIVAKKDISRGEELNFNYGYNLEDYQDHPCRCGSKNCLGYIVGEEYREKLKKLLSRNH